MNASEKFLAADAHVALHRDLSPQQTDIVLRNRQAQTGAAIFPARLRLLECLKNPGKFLRCNSYARVANFALQSPLTVLFLLSAHTQGNLS